MSTTFSKKFSKQWGGSSSLFSSQNHPDSSCRRSEWIPWQLYPHPTLTILPSKLRQRSEILWKGRACAFSLIMKQVYVLHRKYLYGHIFPQLLSSEIHSHFGKRPYIIQTWQGCFKSQISSLLWFTAQPYKRAGITDVWGKVRKQACFMLYCYQKQLTMKPQPL